MTAAASACHDLSGTDSQWWATPAGAVQTLLISDNLFRINDVKKRQRYVGKCNA
jgi:stalled ribosome rescue protein Dom34